MKWNYRIYDDGGKTIDRYTAIFLFDRVGKRYDHRGRRWLYAALAFNGQPFHPQGFGQHTEAMAGRHLGKRISMVDLPEDAREFVTRELENYAKVDK